MKKHLIAWPFKTLSLTLTWRINIAILLSAILIISLGFVFSVFNSHAKTIETMSASLDLARLSIEDGVKNPDHHNARFWQSQFGLSAGTQNLRIRLILPNGKAIEYKGDWQNILTHSIPMWFQRLVTPNAITHNKVIATDIGNVRAIIHIDPGPEIKRSWETSKALFWLLSLQALMVSILLHMVISRALLSVPKIIKGLSALENNQFANRLPIMNVPEFTHISEAINHTAYALEKMSKENRALITQSLKVQEEERQVLARELHDELGQSLLAIKMTASSIDSDNRKISDARESIVSICDHVFAEIRSMMRRLRPSVLDDLGLTAALQDMITIWNSHNKIKNFFYEIDDAIDDCSASVKIHVYRIIQEALNNISKHSHADDVAIEVQVISESDLHRREARNNDLAKNITAANDNVDREIKSCIKLMIHDNGKGFDDSQNPMGFGLMGLRERVAILNGEFSIQTKPNEGVSIDILIPCHDQQNGQ